MTRSLFYKKRIENVEGSIGTIKADIELIKTKLSELQRAVYYNVPAKPFPKIDPYDSMPNWVKDSVKMQKLKTESYTTDELKQKLGLSTECMTKEMMESYKRNVESYEYSLKEIHKAEINCLRDEIKELKSKYECEYQAVKKYAIENHDLRKRIEELAQSLSYNMATTSIPSMRIHDMIKRDMEINNLKTRNKQLESDVKVWTENTMQWRNECKDLKEENERLKSVPPVSTLEGIVKENQELLKLKSHVEALELRNRQLEYQLRKSKANFYASTLCDIMRELKISLPIVDTTHKSDSEFLQIRIDNLKDAFKQLKSDIEIPKTMFENCKTINENLECENQKLKTENQNAKSEIEKWKTSSKIHQDRVCIWKSRAYEIKRRYETKCIDNQLSFINVDWDY